MNHILFLILYFIIVFSTFFYLKKTIKKEIRDSSKKIMEPLNIQTSFDPLISSDGMKVINEFLRVIYLKFINSKLIQNSADTNMPMYKLLGELANGDKMTSFAQGFVILVTNEMSNDLKYFFNKYYNIINEDGELNDNFTLYVTEWFISAIRAQQAQVSLLMKDKDDYSEETNIVIDSQITTALEFELYTKLNITESEKVE